MVSLAGTISSCLLLGFGLYWKDAAILAAILAVVLFVLALICLLAGTVYYIREVTVALSSVQEEARDSRFMNLGAPPEIRGVKYDTCGLTPSEAHHNASLPCR